MQSFAARMSTTAMALVIISGGFDLSVSGTVPLGAVAYAVLVNDGVNVPAAMDRSYNRLRHCTSFDRRPKRSWKLTSFVQIVER